MDKILSAVIMGAHATKLLSQYDMEKAHRLEICHLVGHKLMVFEKVYP